MRWGLRSSASSRHDTRGGGARTSARLPSRSTTRFNGRGQAMTRVSPSSGAHCTRDCFATCACGHGETMRTSRRRPGCTRSGTCRASTATLTGSALGCSPWLDIEPSTRLAPQPRGRRCRSRTSRVSAGNLRRPRLRQRHSIGSRPTVPLHWSGGSRPTRPTWSCSVWWPGSTYESSRRSSESLRARSGSVSIAACERSLVIRRSDRRWCDASSRR